MNTKISNEYRPLLLQEWDYEKNIDCLPSDYSCGSNKKVWWKCLNCGYEWKTSIYHRTSGQGCPVCSKRRTAEKLSKKNLVPGQTDLTTLFPEISAQWDYSKNLDSPENNSPFSQRKKWWICPVGHSYKMTISNKTAGNQGCPICAGKQVLAGFNDLASQFPDIAEQWDYDHNLKKPAEVTARSSYKAFWICQKNHSYRASVADRTRDDGKATGCPYCYGRKAWLGDNDLATVRPDLANQWDYDANGDLKPTDVTEFSMKKVYWKCEKGHSWISPIAYRSTGNNCPYCSNKKVLKGYNDLVTLFPEVAIEWDYERNIHRPEEYVPGAHTHVWWRCKKCGNEWKAQIKERTYGHTGCPKCTHYFKTSFPEQIVFYYVHSIFPDAINSYKPDYLDGAEIDVFVPSLRLAIEYDGSYWHKNIGRDKNKTIKLKDNEICLIRLREKGLPSLDDGSIEIRLSHCSEKLDEWKPVLIKLIEVINEQFELHITIDVDIYRDMSLILQNSEGSKYEKSLMASGSKIIQEWNYEKNGELNPTQVTPHSHKVVWWECSNCGKEWQQSINSKFKSGLCCELCNKSKANQKRTIENIALGKTKPLSDYPLLMLEWDNEDDINHYSYGSEKKVRWRCSKCGNVFYKTIKCRTIQGQGCPKCHSR